MRTAASARFTLRGQGEAWAGLIKASLAAGLDASLLYSPRTGLPGLNRRDLRGGDGDPTQNTEQFIYFQLNLESFFLA